MTEVYYVQNEKAYRKLLINLFKDTEDSDRTLEFGICGCDYAKDEEGEWYDNCTCCEEEECKLFSYFEDKDILSHIHLINDSNLEFPAILVIADTHYEDEKFTFIPVYEAKENTKYGYNGYW